VARNGIPEDVFRRIRVDIGLRESAPVVEGYATSVTTPTHTLQILGIDPLSEAPFRPELTPGNGLGGGVAQLLTQPDAVLMSRGTATALGATLGQPVYVTIAGARQAMVLVGLLETNDAATQRL
jgi:putative ABC transport system permease protein